MDVNFENIEDTKKKLKKIFDFNLSSKTRTLFPVYGKGTGKINTNRDWYFVFLNANDCYWIIEDNQINFKKNRGDFYRQFLGDAIKEITYSEFDRVVTKYFRKIHSHIKGATEIWKEWVGFSANYYISNGQSELQITDEDIDFYESKYSRIKKDNIGTDMFKFAPVNTDVLTNQMIEMLMKRIQRMSKHFQPSQIGYKDFLNDVKQIPREKKSY